MSSDNNSQETDNSADEGAIPSLDAASNDRVLGIPESRTKRKTNVGKIGVLLACLGGTLFFVFGILLFAKGRAKAPGAQQVVAAKVDPTKVKNTALDSDSLERVKAEIKHKEEAAAVAQADADAKAAGAAGNGTPQPASAAGAPAASQGNRMATTGVQSAPGAAQVAPAGAPGSQGAPQVVAPRPLTLSEQRLAGDVLLAGNGQPAVSATAPTGGISEQQQAAPRMRMRDESLDEAIASRGRQKPGSMGEMLQPTVLEARRAGRLGNLDFLLKKGMTIPCALRTGIDTTLPGFLTCVAINDVYSANGAVKLIDRGATFFGEQKSNVAQGQARVFVVWTRVDNPSGVFADIDSPATDEMGYSGVGGHVETHFWKRFGGAIMLSLIQDAVGAAVDRRDPGAVQISNTSGTGSAMASEALKGTINIPPTITVLPGKIINVMVARDISFESVYSVVK